MARKPLRPLIRSGGFYPSRKWTPLVYAGGYTTANGGEEPAPPPIEKTITGNPIHILDALAKPAQALSIALEPVQDLNGYSYPWPAGGGKNLFNGTFLQGYWAYADGKWVNSPNWITTEKIPCKASTSYTVSADAKMTRWQGFVWYDSNGDFISTDNLNSNVNIGLTKTSPSTAAYLIFNIAGYPNSTDTIAPSDVTHFQLEEGSASTAYSPYSNICPITGYDDVTLKQSNRNIWAFDADYNPPGYAVLVPRNTEFYLPAGTYTFSAIPDIESSSVVLGGYYADDTQVTLARLNASEERQSATFTIARPLHKMYLIANKGGTISDIQLEVGDTDTGYEAASISTINVSLTSGDNTSTVYGGTLDVTTGKLTVDRAMVDLGAKNWYPSTAAGRTRFRTSITDIERISSPNVRASLLCSNYPTKTANQTYQGTTGVSLQQNSADIYIYDPQTESMTTAEFKSAMSGVQLVYKLDTPIVYDLTPMQIELFTGENNIWSDGEMTLTYLADGNASDEEALNILLGGRYVNNHSEDEPTDREALDILLGGTR